MSDQAKAETMPKVCVDSFVDRLLKTFNGLMRRNTNKSAAKRSSFIEARRKVL
jgi:hypothetical protein